MVTVGMHLHWKFVAYDEELDNHQLMWAVSVSVLGYHSEETALEAVKALVVRKNYKLQQVYECNTCAFQAQQLEIQTQIKDKI